MNKMWELQWVVTVFMLLITILARIDASPHLNQLETLISQVPYGLPDHVDFASTPAVEALPWLPLPAPLVPVPAPAPLVPVPATAQVPIWPAETLPAVAPAPPVFKPAPAPLLPPPTPSLPAIHPHLWPLPPAELHLPTVTQVLPPILEAVPFSPSYRAIPGPKTTSTKVAIGYVFPKLLATPHASLKAWPLKLARYHHHHHSLF